MLTDKTLLGEPGQGMDQAVDRPIVGVIATQVGDHAMPGSALVAVRLKDLK